MAAAIEERVGQLQESDSRFRSIFDSISEAIFLHDREEALRAVPNQFSLGEPPYSAAEALALMDKAVHEGPQTFEWHARTFDGEVLSELGARGVGADRTRAVGWYERASETGNAKAAERLKILASLSD